MIGAVVLAAGLSRRMGRPKLTLPWGNTTVIGRVVAVLREAGVDQVIVVTGASHNEVSAELSDQHVDIVFNPEYQQDDMTLSLKTGLPALHEDVQAAFVALGDQPQISPQVVRDLIARYRQNPTNLLLPSYHMRRGHPWLINRSLWIEIERLGRAETMRTFLHRHQSEIAYLEVDDKSILQDLDTPDDYARARPADTVT